MGHQPYQHMHSRSPRRGDRDEGVENIFEEIMLETLQF